jgi:hypothetical protein
MSLKFRKATRAQLAAATPDNETIIMITDAGTEGLAVGTGSLGGREVGAGAGAGDVTKVGTPADGQVGVWTGNGTIEGDSALTFDTSTDTLAIGASGKLNFGAVNILTDTAGTTTLANIDALDATTETTIEAAIDTLANLTSIQGRTVTLADAGSDRVFGWDDSADAYINLSAADARTAIGITVAAATVLDDGTIADMVNTLGGATSTGTGGLVRATDAVLITPNIGVPSSGTLTNCTGLPITGINLTGGTDIGAALVDADLILVDDGAAGTNRKSALSRVWTWIQTKFGTNVATALGVNVGTTGAFVVNGGALGTPSSGTLSGCTGLPVSGITASTSSAIGVGTIELGHASDTTLARGSAGVVTVEGVSLGRVIASGTAAMGTTSIPSGDHASAVTVSATGVATTDVVLWGFNGTPNGVTGYNAASTTGGLVITAYPTANNVNFIVSNPTASSVTPGALTLNWRVVR